MKIAFRADASLQIGSGHVMRCLTLAEALRAHGAQCQFICRAHSGHLMDVIRQLGFQANCLILSEEQNQQQVQQPMPDYAAWLGSSWQADAQETAAVLANIQPDWLVVDHYGLDHRWEVLLKSHCKKLMVIDDLADRVHCCDLLLDQNLGRKPQDYGVLVPSRCQVLTGPHYALLRPDFSALRTYSLQRRQTRPDLRQLLISMGGVDQTNATGKVLKALKNCALPHDCRISVVLGLKGPWLQSVCEIAAQMPWSTEVAVNVSNMAQRMANSDLAIGAAGSTSWERCCLGLPTIALVLAKNQIESCRAQQDKGLVVVVPFADALQTELAETLAAAMLKIRNSYEDISRKCAATCDGGGTERLTNILETLLEH